MNPQAMLFPTMQELTTLLPLFRRCYERVPNTDTPLNTLKDLLVGRTILFVDAPSKTRVYAIAQPQEHDLIILQAFALSGATANARVLHKYVERWAKENGFVRMVAYTKRNPQALARAYGWRLDSYKMVKELTNGIESSKK